MKYLAAYALLVLGGNATPSKQYLRNMYPNCNQI